METSRGTRMLLTLLHPKVGIPLALGLVVLSAPLLYRVHQIAGLPDPGDPFDVEAFGTVEIAPEENAFVEYRSAAALLVPLTSTDAAALEKAMEGEWSAASQAIRKWVSDNRAALQLWQKGTQKPDAVYHQPKDLSIDTLLPVVQHLRDFARLARLEGVRLEHAGDWDGAREWFRAMFRSSRHCGRHGCIIERLVGNAIHAIAAEALQKWARHPRVDAALLRRALDDVIADYQMTPATSTLFKTEYISAMNTLYRSDLLGPDPAGNVALFFVNEPELSARVLRHVWTNWLAEIDRPLHARSPPYSDSLPLFTGVAATRSGPEALSPAEIETFFNRSLLATVLLPSTMQFDSTVSEEQARQRSLVVSLAAQLFYRQHARFPDKAEDLLEGVLQELPQDPFGKSGESIHYRRDADGALVWSIGQNGADDGGTFLDRPDAGDIGFQLHPPTAKP